MEPNDVFEHATGVPFGTGRGSFPPPTHLLNDGSESVAGPSVAVDRAVFGLCRSPSSCCLLGPVDLCFGYAD